ncbi:hypothetical protein JYT87_00425 [Nitrospira defluvii]|nr:hypothetical protein [Nitrospira defluvii]
MQIRKFKGEDMSGILQTIRKELGPDAVILTTREINRRKPNAPRLVEVTAAIDSNPSPPLQSDRKDRKEAFENRLETVVQSDIYEELQTIKNRLLALKNPERTPEEVPTQKIHEMWLEMKIMLKALTETRQEEPHFSSHQNVLNLFQKLRSYGIDLETAKTLCKGVKADLSLEALWEPERVKHALKEIVENLVKVTGGLEMSDALFDRDSPRTVVFVGPTGVGKTTTLAKLGARQIKEHRKVTLVSIDPEGARDGEKLMRYGDRLGIPAITVSSVDRLHTILSKRSRDELVLIDTEGRSHLDKKGLVRLKELTERIDPRETHLVLSANTKASDLSDMIDQFSILPIDSLLFTKIDETKTFGPLFSAMGRKRKPISYLTTGQEVPDDIEVATAKRFTDLVLQR